MDVADKSGSPQSLNIDFGCWQKVGKVGVVVRGGGGLVRLSQ